MSRSSTLAILRSNAEAIRAKGATALFVYGSRARGDHREDSDWDVFVEFDPARRFSLVQLAAIKLLLDDCLTLETHVTTRDALHPLLKEAIEREAIRVFC